jgi:hypothetical protein
MTKVKVLFLAANPDGTQPLKLDEEIRRITAKVRAAEHPNSLELVSRWAVRPDDLLQALLEIKPHVVHFSGHGSSAAELILLDERGEPKPLSQAALVHVFRILKDNVRVVVLNACFSRPQAEALAQTIDCTVGMNRAIGDEAAVVFAASFYQAIGFGRSVEEAFELGRAALLLEGIAEDKTPQLHVRDGVDASKTVLIPLSGSTRLGAEATPAAISAAPAGTEVFFSYSHKDERHRANLVNALAVLKRQGVIRDWHDRKITAGSDLKGKIDEHLDSAGVILLLVSPDFIASDYCYEVEMKRALERHERGDARVIPIILRPVDGWYSTPFGKLLAAPTDGKAVTLWPNKDQAFADVAAHIRRAVEDLRNPR